MAENSKRSSRTSMRSKQIGQLLVDSGDVASDQLAEALKTQDAHGGMIGAILRDMGACTGQAIAQALAKQIQVTEIQCEELTATPEALHGVSKEFCLHEKVCPFELLGGESGSGTLCVVMGNPLNRKSLTDIEAMTLKKVKAFKGVWNKIHELIERSYAEADAAPQQDELEPLSLDLEGEPSGHLEPPPAQEEEPLDDSLMLDDVPDIIPPAAANIEPAGPTGILEIPMDDDVPIPVAVPQKPEKPKFTGTIKGLDTLDSGNAEIVDMKKRGASLKPSQKIAPAKREAKVNVDLDKFDLTTPSETISVPPQGEHEAMDEIEQNGFEGKESRKSGEVLVVLKLIPDSYFYAGPSPRNAPRSEELMDIIEALPVAEVLASDIGAYERAKSGADAAASSPAQGMGIGLLGKNRIELQRAPATPMTAIRLGEGEFQKLTLISVEDMVGEWDWKCSSPGPIAVEVFED